MATRFYYVATIDPGITPSFDAGWASTTGAVRRTMASAQAAATETLSGTLAGTAGDNELAAQLVSAPIQAQTISGTFTLVSRGREVDLADNINKRYRVVKVVSGDGSSVTGTLFAFSASASTTELLTSLAGQQHALAGAVSSVSANAGDRILVEVGYGESATGTTPDWELVLGGTGTDHDASTNNDTTGTVPWFELSADITFVPEVSVAFVRPVQFPIPPR